MPAPRPLNRRAESDFASIRSVADETRSASSPVRMVISLSSRRGRLSGHGRFIPCHRSRRAGVRAEERGNYRAATTATTAANCLDSATTRKREHVSLGPTRAISRVAPRRQPKAIAPRVSNKPPWAHLIHNRFPDEQQLRRADNPRARHVPAAKDQSVLARLTGPHSAWHTPNEGWVCARARSNSAKRYTDDKFVFVAHLGKCPLAQAWGLRLDANSPRAWSVPCRLLIGRG